MSKNMGGFCINGADTHIIGINSNHSKVRQKFTLAYELYHLLFENNFNNVLFCNDEKNEAENEADCFASFLSMTDEGLRRYIKINRFGF